MDLDTGLEERITRFCRLIEHWSGITSLVRFASEEDLARHHILESLYLQRFIAQHPDELVDIGSGAGFPGLLIAMGRPELTVHLIESNKRKAVFLSEAARELQLNNVRVFGGRYQEFDPQTKATTTCRALERLEMELQRIIDHFAASPLFLFLLGRGLLDRYAIEVPGLRKRTFRIPLAKDRYLLEVSRECST
ncbi:MAG: 16S rRNA (guanine(527)-N(7))-methyltransferase RsmG [Acidobacteria bacterium]|nr:16S rRNA (guanine(527)-N(7))-methyltransferase RsmG [Acidobacteriota bacterium]